MTIKRPHLHRKRQDGMVSITVTIVFIMVISLVVLGFSQVSRRNNREALDRQLSSQAFYAAETGINDAMREITKKINRAEPVPKQDTCSGEYTKDDGKVDAANEIAYTCLTVNPVPDELLYSNVADTSLAIPLNAVTADGAATVINTMTISWHRTAGNGNSTKPATCPKPRTAPGIQWTNFPTSSNWSSRCPFGVLRMDIVPTTSENLSDPIVAGKNTLTAFIYPKAGGEGDTITYGNGSQNAYTPNAGAPQGLVQAAGCDEEACKFTVNGLNFSSAYLRIRTVYLDSRTVSVKIGDTTLDADGASGEAFLSRAQAVIDATGKSQDVLRRIQVRVPLVGSGSRTTNKSFSDYALQTSDSICKRYIMSPGYSSDLSSCD